MTTHCQSCPFAACEDCRFQPTDSCPTGLGYRFHRHPCRRAGEIEPTQPTANQEADHD